MKVIYIGHGFCGKIGLETIAQDFMQDLEIGCVVNNRECSDDPDAVPGLAKKLGLEVYDGRTEDPEFLEFVRNFGPDFGVIMRYPHKLRKEFFSLFRHGIFNTHPSDLPKHRGAAPLEYCVAEGAPLIATSFQIRERFDDGPILCKTPGTDITGKYLEDIFPMAVYETNEVLRLTIETMLREDYSLIEQDSTKATSAKRKGLPKLLSFNLGDNFLEVYRKILARGRNGTEFEFHTGLQNVLVEGVEKKVIGSIGEVRGKLLQCSEGCLVLDKEYGSSVLEQEVTYDFKKLY